MPEERCQEEREWYETALEAADEALHELEQALEEYEAKWEELGEYFGLAEEALEKLEECVEDASPRICTYKVVEYYAYYLGHTEDKFDEIDKAEKAIEKAQHAFAEAKSELGNAMAAQNQCIEHWAAKPWLLQ